MPPPTFSKIKRFSVPFHQEPSSHNRPIVKEGKNRAKTKPFDDPPPPPLPHKNLSISDPLRNQYPRYSNHSAQAVFAHSGSSSFCYTDFLMKYHVNKLLLGSYCLLRHLFIYLLPNQTCVVLLFSSSKIIHSSQVYFCFSPVKNKTDILITFMGLEIKTRILL